MRKLLTYRSQRRSNWFHRLLEQANCGRGSSLWKAQQSRNPRSKLISQLVLLLVPIWSKGREPCRGWASPWWVFFFCLSCFGFLAKLNCENCIWSLSLNLPHLRRGEIKGFDKNPRVRKSDWFEILRVRVFIPGVAGFKSTRRQRPSSSSRILRNINDYVSFIQKLSSRPMKNQGWNSRMFW